LKSGLQDLKYLLFSFEGRIDRPTYWIGFAILMIPGLMAAGMAEYCEGPYPVLGLILYICLVWPTAAVDVKRWHDLNKPWYWFCLKMVPLIGPIWALIDLGFRRGSVGPNQFGADPSGAEGEYGLLPRLNDLAVMLYWMYRTDHSMPPDKIAVVDNFFRQALGLDGALHKRAMKLFHQAGRSDHDFEFHARCFSNVHWENSGLLKDTLRGLFYTAVTDGKISPEEKAILEQASEIFKMECPEYKAWHANQR